MPVILGELNHSSSSLSESGRDSEGGGISSRESRQKVEGSVEDRHHLDVTTGSGQGGDQILGGHQHVPGAGVVSGITL